MVIFVGAHNCYIISSWWWNIVPFYGSNGSEPIRRPNDEYGRNKKERRGPRDEPFRRGTGKSIKHALIKRSFHCYGLPIGGRLLATRLDASYGWFFFFSFFCSQWLHLMAHTKGRAFQIRHRLLLASLRQLNQRKTRPQYCYNHRNQSRPFRFPVDGPSRWFFFFCSASVRFDDSIVGQEPFPADQRKNVNGPAIKCRRRRRRALPT